MNAQVKIWDRAAICELIATDDRAVARAILQLYARQTADEQQVGVTKVANGRGFNAKDAPFLTSIAQALPKWQNRMTMRQLEVARRMLPKYARQLLEEIEARGGVVCYDAKSRIREVAEVVAPAAEPDPIPEPKELAVLEAQTRLKWGMF